MRITILTTLLMAFTFAGTTLAQQRACSELKFTNVMALCLPAGWSGGQNGPERAIAYADMGGSNIIFRRVDLDVPLYEFAGQEIRALFADQSDDPVTNVRITGFQEFRTALGDHYLRAVANEDFEGQHFRVIHYFIAGGGSLRFLITTTMKADDKTTEALADQAIRTLRFVE